MSWASWPQGFQRISHPQLKYIYVPDGDTYRQIGEGGGSLALVGNTARPGPGGKQVQFGGGSSDGATITRDYALSFTQGITMLVVFRPTASGTKYTLAAAGSGGGEVLQFATNTSGGIQCDAQALANLWSTGNLGIALGGVFCAAVTAVNGGRTKGFFRGAQVADAATRAGMSGGVTALHFARRGSSGETMNGGVHFVAMGDYMPDSDVKALTRNPFGLYPAPRRSCFIGGFPVGGTPTLTIADALHAHTADNLTLTQQHVLTVADASHAHLADGLTLTQNHVLAIADALHAHAADNVVLSVEGTLAVADALHAHTADNLALTQTHVLAVADALHAHLADNLTLVSGGTTLEIADALHAHLADSPALTQLHILTVSDALHAHLADTLTLSVPGAAILHNRVLLVRGENRTLVILPENRTLTVH